MKLDDKKGQGRFRNEWDKISLKVNYNTQLENNCKTYKLNSFKPLFACKDEQFQIKNIVYAGCANLIAFDSF
jgi:hypothetical protein